MPSTSRKLKMQAPDSSSAAKPHAEKVLSKVVRTRRQGQPLTPLRLSQNCPLGQSAGPRIESTKDGQRSDPKTKWKGKGKCSKNVAGKAQQGNDVGDRSKSLLVIKEESQSWAEYEIGKDGLLDSVDTERENMLCIEERQSQDIVLETAAAEEVVETVQVSSDLTGEETDKSASENQIEEDEMEYEEEDNLESTQMKVPPKGRKVGHKYDLASGNEKALGRLSNDDVRNRLHYVKYVRKDGKTIKFWECGLCSKEFRHQYTLMRHLPTHTDERNYKCSTCGKAFRQMSTLSQHRAIHSDARPYVCELCQKTFNRVSTLISHRKTHMDNKPHKCNVCGKGFHQKGNLKNHVYTHTNERPYKCEDCGRGFNQMSNLMCHKVKAHNVPEKCQYECGICQKDFPQRYALRTHVEYEHGIKCHSVENQEELASMPLKDTAPRKQKKNDQRKLRVIYLPNGDRTLADVRNIEEHTLNPGYQKLNMSKLLSTSSTLRIPGESRCKVMTSTLMEEVVPSPGQQTELENASAVSGVTIDPIETKSMEVARKTGHVPFALLKPARGIPVLVKVMPAPNNKQMLVPATADDLRIAGKIIVSPQGDKSNGNSEKAVQIKVPVVATVIQRIGPNGELTIQVEPTVPNLDSGSDEEMSKESTKDVHSEEEKVQEIAVGCEEVIDSSAAVSPTHVHFLQQEDMGMNEVEEMVDETEELFATNGDNMENVNHQNVQFLRQAANGSYEILSEEEAAQVMNQSGQLYQLEESAEQIVFASSNEETEQVLVNDEGYPIEMVIEGSEATQEVHFLVEGGKEEVVEMQGKKASGLQESITDVDSSPTS